MIKQAKQFFATHKAWLGEGMRPVPQALADARAAKCRQCPYHIQRPLYESLTGAAVKALREIAAYKNHLKLEVEREDELHVCNVCQCVLPAKVWVPIGNIVAGTDQVDFDKLPNYCWQVIERKEAAK